MSIYISNRGQISNNIVVSVVYKNENKEESMLQTFDYNVEETIANQFSSVAFPILSF